MILLFKWNIYTINPAISQRAGILIAMSVIPMNWGDIGQATHHVCNIPVSYISNLESSILTQVSELTPEGK